LPLFFFTHTPTTDIYTLSLHDALPISEDRRFLRQVADPKPGSAVHRHSSDVLPIQQNPAGHRWYQTHDHVKGRGFARAIRAQQRSEEHTSELQSLAYLVCRLLLEKKKK